MGVVSGGGGDGDGDAGKESRKAESVSNVLPTGCGGKKGRTSGTVIVIIVTAAGECFTKGNESQCKVSMTEDLLADWLADWWTECGGVVEYLCVKSEGTHEAFCSRALQRSKSLNGK